MGTSRRLLQSFVSAQEYRKLCHPKQLVESILSVLLVKKTGCVLSDLFDIWYGSFFDQLFRYSFILILFKIKQPLLTSAIDGFGGLFVAASLISFNLPDSISEHKSRCRYFPREEVGCSQQLSWLHSMADVHSKNRADYRTFGYTTSYWRIRAFMSYQNKKA